MTTAHVNPGYKNIVSRFRSANENPRGLRPKIVVDKEELEQIKSKAKSVWSAKDTSETTYGHFHSDPLIKEKAVNVRPSSPTRRNNPHPHLVFLTARLKTLPGYFNCKEEGENEQNLNSASSASFAQTRFAQPSVVVFPNTHTYIESLEKNEAQQAEANFKKAGVSSTSSGPTTTTYQELGPRSNSFYRSANSSKSQSLANFNTAAFNEEFDHDNTKNDFRYQPNMLNPYLYDDYRVYREKYQSGDHGGLQHAFARRPFRGDFSIHYDWPPKIKHHRLPYMY